MALVRDSEFVLKRLFAGVVKLCLAGFLSLIAGVIGYYYFGQNFVTFFGVMSLLGAGLMFMMNKQKLVWRLLLATGLVLLAIKMSLAILFPVRPVSDFGAIMNASWQLSTGDTSYRDSNYFMTWGFNIGQVIYQAVILKIFGSELAIAILNAFFNIGSLYLSYLIAKKLYSGTAAGLAMIIFGGMFFALTYSGIASNQHLFLLISLAALYQYMVMIKQEQNHLKGFLRIGSLLSIANIIRPEAIIFVMAMICDQLFSQKINRQAIKKAAGLIASYLVVGLVLGQMAIWGGVSNIGFKSANPWFKFRTGLNLTTMGGYSSQDQGLITQMMIEKKITAAQADRELLITRLKDPNFNLVRFVKLAIKKLIIMWTGGRLYWFNDKGLVLSPAVAELERYDNFIVLVLAVLGLIGLWRRKLNAVCYALFLTVGIYTLIEIQSRYTLTSFYLMAILAAGGLDNLWRLLLQKLTQPQLQACVARVLING